MNKIKDMKQKIINLVTKRKARQGGFAKKSNAAIFGTALRKKGYSVGLLRSSGPVVEGGYKKNAYYVYSVKRRRV